MSNLDFVQASRSVVEKFISNAFSNLLLCVSGFLMFSVHALLKLMLGVESSFVIYLIFDHCDSLLYNVADNSKPIKSSCKYL